MVTTLPKSLFSRFKKTSNSLLKNEIGGSNPSTRELRSLLRMRRFYMPPLILSSRAEACRRIMAMKGTFSAAC
jgi:RNase P/RNase MRP subunit p30